MTMSACSTRSSSSRRSALARVGAAVGIRRAGREQQRLEFDVVVVAIGRTDEDEPRRIAGNAEGARAGPACAGSMAVRRRR